MMNEVGVVRVMVKVSFWLVAITVAVSTPPTPLKLKVPMMAELLPVITISAEQTRQHLDFMIP